MAHEIEKLTDGSYSFAYNLEEGLPWHGLGTPTEGALTASAMIEAANLDWNVELRPVYQQLHDGSFVQIADRYATTRTSDDKALGVVGKDYKVIQNREAFDFFDTLVDDGDAKYQTAGSLAGGKRIFLTAHVGEDFQVAGQDTHRLYIALLSSHDGSKSLTAITTMVRIVCANTENLALKSAKTSWTMTHRQTLAGKVAEAREALQLSYQYRDEFEKEMERLISVQIETDKFREIMTSVLPDQKRQLPKNLDTLTALFETSPTIVDAGLAGTGLGAFNAVTEWLTHGREVRSQEARMVNSLWGFGAQVRNKTRDRILATV